MNIFDNIIEYPITDIFLDKTYYKTSIKFLHISDKGEKSKPGHACIHVSDFNNNYYIYMNQMRKTRKILIFFSCLSKDIYLYSYKDNEDNDEIIRKKGSINYEKELDKLKKLVNFIRDYAESFKGLRYDRK